MSITDPPVTDGVQPESGQGDDGQQSNVPYAEHLARVPDEVRGDIEPIFRDWNSHVNSRFEEHANYRKQWEPYEQAGITQYQPDQIAAAFQLLQDPQGLRAWADEQYGPVQAQPEPQADPFTGFEDPTSQQLEQLLEQKLGPLSKGVEEIMQWRQQQEQQAHQQQIQSQIEAEVAALKEKHAASLPEDVRNNFEDIIDRFGMKYAEAGADPRQVVAKAWADFETLSNQLQTAALQSKVDQPAPAEAGGTADLNPEMPKTLKEAREIALAQLRANRAA